LPPPLSPQEITQHFDAACKALVAGDLATTELLCQALITQAPQDVRAWILLTETALRRNRPDAALVCAEKAAALAPNDPIAFVMQAKCLVIAGDTVRARQVAEAAGRIANPRPEALDGLGAIFGQLGLHDRALALFRRAVAARPETPQFLFNLAATERMLGLFEDAEAHCDAAIARDRRFCLAHFLRSDLRIQTPERNHIAEMEGLIRDDGIGWQNEVLLRFALGKEFEDLEAYAEAFRHVEAGARLQRRHMNYDVRAEIAAIDRIIAGQTRAWLAAASPGFDEAEPVFVLGLPRSGTTVIERILAGHSRIVSAGEAGVFSREAARSVREAAEGVGGSAVAGGPPRIDFATLGRRYVDRVTALAAPGSRHILDKTLQNYLSCGLIHAALPRARIILVRRHPIDTCWALYKAHFQGTFAFSYDQAELAEYYLAFRRLAEHWKAVLPPHVFTGVAYEAMLCNPEAESRRLLAFLRLPWEEEVLRFHASTTPSATASAVQVRRPLYTTSVGNWRHYAEELIPLRRRLAQTLPPDELD
jgi:tetratricopeptide (TPR) repeat protein